MLRKSTLYLKLIIFLFGSAVLALCIFVLPEGIISDTTGMYRPLLIGMYVPAIPFFIGAVNAFRILNLIDRHQAFSQEALKALNIIKFCGVFIGILYAIALPYFFIIAEIEDAPGVVLVGLIFTFAPIIVAVLSAILEKLLKDAKDIKFENDLTV